MKQLTTERDLETLKTTFSLDKERNKQNEDNLKFEERREKEDMLSLEKRLEYAKERLNMKKTQLEREQAEK